VCTSPVSRSVWNRADAAQNADKYSMNSQPLRISVSKPAGTGLAILALALAGMLAYTWGTWPDPVVDFGRELYVPWQLSQGKVLYRDIAYFNGPLSAYFNSFLFRTLGVSLLTLVVANIAILA